MFNLLMIANKPGAALAMHNAEYNTYEAAMAAVETLRQGLKDETGYSIRFFVTAKGKVSL
jgi:hypothetical protein